MSRAFVKELDRDEDLPAPDPVLPPGAQNVITRDGAERLRAEAAALREERAALKRAGRPEDAVRLRIVERRLAWFARRSETWVERDPPAAPDAVRLGTRVTLIDAEGRARRVRIVGVDEVDAAAGDISWISPLATALLGARPGDVVTLRRPGGEEELEVGELG